MPDRAPPTNRDAPAAILRPALPVDWDAVARIWHAGASLPGVGPAALPSLAELRAEIDGRLADGWVVTVAERNGAVVGFLALQPLERILDQLFVAPDQIASGIGQLLFAHAKREMPDGFTLFTRPANARACRFYERQGLRLIGTETHPRFGDPIVRYGTAA